MGYGNSRTLSLIATIHTKWLRSPLGQKQAVKPTDGAFVTGKCERAALRFEAALTEGVFGCQNGQVPNLLSADGAIKGAAVTDGISIP